MPEISIIVPVFNVETEYFKKCMTSLINQTLRNIEIILINDGSTNGCEQKCNEYGKLDSRIKVIHQKNQGVSVARNEGIKVAQSPWITFVDPDDWVDLTMCETLIKNLQQNPNTDILMWSYVKDTLNNEDIVLQGYNGLKKLTKEEKELLLLNLIDAHKRLDIKWDKLEIFGSVWSKCYKLDLIKKNDIYFFKDLHKSQDTVFNLYAIENAENILYLDKAMYHYRLNDSSICNRYNLKIELLNECLHQRIVQYIEIYKKGELFSRCCACRQLNNYTTNLALNYFHKDNQNGYLKNKNEWKKMISTGSLKNDLKNLLKYEKNKLNLKTKALIYFSIYKQYFAITLLWKMRNATIKKKQLYN